MPNDNGKWYCFRARDAAGNWGFKSRQVPADAVDTTKPVLSFVSYDSNTKVARFKATKPVKWSLQHSSQKWTSCSGVSFSNAATALKTAHTFSTGSVAAGTLRYYCLKGVDSGGRVGHSKPYLVDRKKPEVTLSVSNNKLKVTASDDSGIASRNYSIVTFVPRGLPCARATYGSNLSADGLTITASMHNKYACIVVTDQTPDRNETKKQHKLVFTPSEPEPTPQLQPARPTSPAGYEKSRLVSTNYDRLPSSNDIADPIKPHIDDNFVFYVKKQSAPGEHLEFKLATPGKLSAAAVSRTKVQSFAVHSIDYIDVSQRSDCNSNLFDDSTRTSVNGIHMSDSFTRPRSEAAEHSGELPLFTSQYAQYMCTKVTLKADDKSRGVSHLFKIFVTEDTVDVPTESRQIRRRFSPAYQRWLCSLGNTASHMNIHY